MQESTYLFNYFQTSLRSVLLSRIDYVVALVEEHPPLGVGDLLAQLLQLSVALLDGAAAQRHEGIRAPLLGGGQGAGGGGAGGPGIGAADL